MGDGFNISLSLPTGIRLHTDSSSESRAFDARVELLNGAQKAAPKPATDLARSLAPSDAGTRALLGRIEKLDILRANPKASELRTGSTLDVDRRFQVEAQKLVAQGVIGPGSLVMSDTGDDIPIMASLMITQNMSGVVRLPDFKDTSLGNGSRVISQAATFGPEIESANRKLEGAPDSYFLGLEGHRGGAGESGKVDPSKLPTAQAL